MDVEGVHKGPGRLFQMTGAATWKPLVYRVFCQQINPVLAIMIMITMMMC